MQKSLTLGLWVCMLLMAANVAMAGAPQLTTAKATDSSHVELEWRDPGGLPFIQTYEIERNGASIVTDLPNTQFSHIDDTAEPDNNYTYRIIGVTGLGAEHPSNPDDVKVMEVPANLQANAVAHNQVELTWEDKSGLEDGYKIERKATGDFEEIGTVTGTTYSDTTGLAEGTQYIYRVRAYAIDVDAYDYSSYSGEVSVTTMLNPPTGLNAEKGFGTQSTGIKLTWTDQSGLETNYKIERQDSAGRYLPIATLGADSESYTDDFRPGGKTCHYRVYAYNADAMSDPELAKVSETADDYPDVIDPVITSQNPPDGMDVIINYREPYAVQIGFAPDLMDRESVLKSMFIRRLGDETGEAEVINADICTLLTWFGHQGDAPEEKYNRYGCSPPYGTVDAGMVDATFDDAQNLTINMQRLDIGNPTTGPIRPAVYTLEILHGTANYPTDLAGNELDKEHTTYDVTMRATATVGSDPNDPIEFRNVDSTLIVTIIPADFGLSEGDKVTVRPIYPGETDVETVEGTLGTFVIETGGGSSLLSMTSSSTGQITVGYPDDAELPVHPGEAAIRVYEPDADNNRWAPILGVLPNMDTNTLDVEVEIGEPYAVINSVPYGDLNGENGDGLRNVHDVLSIMKHIVTPTQKPIFNDVDPTFAKYASDVSITTPGADPEEPNVGDVLFIMKEIVGLIDKYPVEGITAAPGLITLYPPVSGDSTLFLKHSNFGNNGTISVILDGVSDILSTEVGLVYDTKALKFTGISQTSLLPNRVVEYSENDGELQIALVSVQPLSNEDSILNIQFEMAEGANKLELDSVKLTKVKLNNGLVKARVEPLPQKLALLQNYPNPFNPETWIPYRLNQGSDVKIRIYNINGQLVQTLNIGKQSPGNYVTKEEAAYWDGRNSAGEKVTSGVYFYQLLTTGNDSIIRKMVVLK